MTLIVNVLAFKVAWAASVVGGAQQMPWLGPLVVLAAVVWHLYATRRPTRELALIASCAVIGTAFDSLLLAAGWVSYSSGLFSEVVAPYWIVTMWMLFATTLNVSMRWLRGRETVAVLLGLVGGPSAYLAAQKIGAVVLVEQTTALLALGIGWAVMMPLLARLAHVFDGAADDAQARSFAAEPA